MENIFTDLGFGGSIITQAPVVINLTQNLSSWNSPWCLALGQVQSLKRPFHGSPFDMSVGTAVLQPVYHSGSLPLHSSFLVCPLGDPPWLSACPVQVLFLKASLNARTAGCSDASEAAVVQKIYEPVPVTQCEDGVDNGLINSVRD